MTPEEQLLEIKEEIRSLKASIAELLAEDRLEKIVSKQLHGLKEHISKEIAQLHEMLLEQKGDIIQIKEQEKEPSGDSGEHNNWSEQTLILDRNREKVMLYAGLPVNGIFFADKISNHFTARKTFYRIILDQPNAETGLLDLVTDSDTLATAFYVPDTYLSACELRGIGNLTYEKMKNLQPGKVQAKGPNWVIEQKITIEYGE